MKKFYLLAISFYFILLGARAFDSRTELLLSRHEVADTIRRFQQRSRSSSKIIDNRPDRPTRNELKINITPFRPSPARSTAGAGSSGSSAVAVTSSSGSASAQKTAAQDVKALNNVKVYPNPVEDQINISYSLNRDANVTIKIMDVLGNEIATLLSQRLPAGEQNHSFSVGSALNSGYYFIRVITGNETIIKRISVL
ncbi:T9SS type A sorting domain-containing protein [Arcticibacter sp. MXS-1]|uniref:T9SS type A sorting domain-containing protein n=1 Tax=Arcticibacter sp. MXS-1 TaxID=3341726 RepID=UPI0035A98D47